MPAPTAEEYRAFIHENLVRHTKALTTQLREIIALHFHPEVVFLDFEVFPYGLTEELPVRGFLMDSGYNEVFHNDPGYFAASSLDLLPDIPHIIPLSEKARTDAFLKADIPLYEIEIEALIPWFARCWIAADGERFSLPAYICRHDDIQSFDLKQQLWLPDEEGKYTHLRDE